MAYKDDHIMWEIKEDGYAYFHNIEADNGIIAGWYITSDMIYNAKGTCLSASGNAASQNGGPETYTISTNSLCASSGNIGGWSMSPSGFSGTNIQLLNRGQIKLGNVTLENRLNGLIISGPTIIEGIANAWDFTTVIEDNKTFSLNDVFRDFEIAKYDGTAQHTRRSYLDYLHNNWGLITPNQVREAGFNATDAQIDSIRIYTDENYNNNTITLSCAITIELSLPANNFDTSHSKQLVRVEENFTTLNCSSFYWNGYWEGYAKGVENGYAQAQDELGG